MKPISSQEIYEYLSNEYRNLTALADKNEEIIKTMKKSHDLDLSNFSNPKINKEIIRIVSELESKLLERTYISQRYIACLSSITSVIGIEGSEFAKNIKEGVEKFYEEKEHFVKDIAKNEGELLRLINDIYKEELGS